MSGIREKPAFAAACASLPVGGALDAIGKALRHGNCAVLAAPPGAGKTTLVPLWLLDAAWRGQDRIIVLEPRRLAARAAARRMADLIGGTVGGTVGYRMRLDTKISGKTRIEVVTEGVFKRMVLDDPELSGIAAIIFDEFHERALDADFALALALDVQGALRPDLRLLVMSATLDIARVSALLGNAPVIESQGRAFPVDIRYRERGPDERIEEAVAAAIRAALAGEDGSILAFLPGQAEIRRTAERLATGLPGDVVVAPLYGMMESGAQDRAIRPPPEGIRKVVLATGIAETSITIDGVRIVIDSGLQRLPRFEPATGITRLETLRVSRASADQRAGRAGRTAPGIAIRLWRAEQTAALPAFTPPEILNSDLSGFILDCAAWGVGDPAHLAFLDPPPPAALAEARILLATLGALDGSGGLTPTGRAMRTIALPSRLAAMIVKAPPGPGRKTASELGVLLTEPGLGGMAVDLTERLRRFRAEKGVRAATARELARNFAKNMKEKDTAFDETEGTLTPGGLLLLAYPDRLAVRRGAAGRYLLANGRGAEIEAHEALAGERYLVVADLTGRAGAQRILSAAAIADDEVEAVWRRTGTQADESFFDMDSRSVRARRIRRIGAVVLEDQPLPPPAGEAAARALADGVRRLGIAALPWDRRGLQLRDRLGFLHRTIGPPWPDVDDAALIAALDDWFTPFCNDVRSFDAIDPDSLAKGLLTLLPFDVQGQVDTLAPTHFETPAGSRIAIRYDGDEPVLAVRVQELFGLKTHPALAGGRLPLVLELLSPAQRPIQTTRDLPGFWQGSWAEVRAGMRGRYPRHPWPERPENEQATKRAKPRTR